MAAAIVVYRQERTNQMNRFAAQAQNGIPQNLDAPKGMDVCLRILGNAVELNVLETGRDRYRVGPKGSEVEVTFRGLTSHTATLEISGERHELLYSHGSMGIYVEIDGAGHDIEELAGGTVKAPAPAMVVSVAVEEGERVEVGDRLVTLEAMKMEMPVLASEPGIVSSVLVRANMQVAAGQALIVVDAEEGETPQDGDSNLLEGLNVGSPMDRLFEANGSANMLLLDSMSESDSKEVVDDILRTLRNVMLGYDVSPGVMRKLFSLFREDGKFSRMEHPERLLPLAEVLQSFVAVESLFDRNLLPLEEQPAAVSAQMLANIVGTIVWGMRQYQAIETVLRSALALYKVTSLEPTDELREALWRLAVATVIPWPGIRFAPLSCGV